MESLLRRFSDPQPPADALALAPRASGLYLFERPDGSRVYLGISKTSLRTRLRQHLRGRIAGSTLRFSLAALLATQLRLAGTTLPSGRRVLIGDGEARLSEWLAGELRLRFLAHPTPELVERELIEALRPELNLAGLAGPESPLAAARRALASA